MWLTQLGRALIYATVLPDVLTYYEYGLSRKTFRARPHPDYYGFMRISSILLLSLAAVFGTGMAVAQPYPGFDIASLDRS